MIHQYVIIQYVACQVAADKFKTRDRQLGRKVDSPDQITPLCATVK
jgi:hypothetical protein